MLKSSQVEQLADKALRLVTDIGILVENEELAAICLKRGAKAGPDGRLRIPSKVIHDMAAFQKKTQEEYEANHELVLTCGPDWTHHLTWTGQQGWFREEYAKRFLMQAFDCGPTTFYDDAKQSPRPVDTAVFDQMMKLAEATPEIGYTSMWYRQDVPPQTERVASLRRAMSLTTKFAGIEAIYPEVVKYLKEASVILTGDARSSAYLAGSECMTMPLILEKRSAEDILERKKRGVNRYHVATMPTLGVSTPVTLAGAVVMGAAELLGGMAVCWMADPETDLSGRVICMVADMRNGNSTTQGPALGLFNNAVRQLFSERWGGHCMAEVYFSPTARRPGLQAVFENWYGTSCRQRWEGDADIPYAGMGTLHGGGLGSPTQLMLDMEIRKAQWAWRRDIPMNDDTLDWDEVVAVTRDKGNFLMCDHTLAHCREFWTSEMFRSDDPAAAGWDGGEQAILMKCEEKWRANLEKWQAPEWPGDKLRAMDGLVARAEKEFGVS